MGYYEPDTEYFEPHELEVILDEYKEKCKAILIQEVCQEIEKLKQENGEYKDRNLKLTEQIGNIHKLKSEFEKNKNKVIQDAITEYQRTALSGLRCGDTIWMIKTEDTTAKCPHCNGRHKIAINVVGVKKDVDCPHCSYGGVITTDKTFTPIPRVISEIKTSIWNENKTFRRFIYCKEIKNMENKCSDEFMYDDEYGSCKDANEDNYNHGNFICRDFYLYEEECMEACKEKRNRWLIESKKR